MICSAKNAKMVQPKSAPGFDSKIEVDPPSHQDAKEIITFFICAYLRIDDYPQMPQISTD